MERNSPNAIESPVKRSLALKGERNLKNADTPANSVIHRHWEPQNEDHSPLQSRKPMVAGSNRNGEKGLRESRARMENTYGKTALPFRFQSAA